MMNKRPYFSLVFTVILILSLVLPTGGARAAGPTMVWCPGIAPSATLPNASGVCTGGTGDQTTFSNLITALSTKSGAGTIYVSTGYSDPTQVGDIIFDRSTTALMNLTNLAITGWTFGTPGAAGTFTISSHGIIIRGGPDWTGTVTLQGLNITNAPSRAVDISATGTVALSNITVNNANSTGGAAAAIRVTSVNANIQGDNINVTNTTSAAPSPTNYGGGAGLIAHNGSVTLTNSTFSNNTGYGIQLADKTTTTLTNVTASGNGRNGLIAASDDPPHAPISITNSVFNNNGNNVLTYSAGNGKGIFTSAGSITLSNVTASGNKEEGLSASAPPAVSISLSTFNNNLKTGLTVVNSTMASSGQVTLDQVTATGNGIIGADVETASASLVIKNSIFSTNGSLAPTPVSTDPSGAGLFVESNLGGTLKSVTAQSNSGAGLYLNSSNHSVHGGPGSMPAVGGGFVVSCGTVGGVSNGNAFNGIVYDLDDTFHGASSDGRLELRNVTLANNTPSQTLGLSGTMLSTVACGVSISGNAKIPGATLTYNDSGIKTATADSTGNYEFIVPDGWGGTVTPSKPGCSTCDFVPDFLTYAGLQADQLSQNFGVGAEVNVAISTTNQGPYLIPPLGSTRISYSGLNNGPVQVISSDTIPIIAAERVIYAVNGTNTSFSEMMGLPIGQLTDTYHFPWYNNVDLDTQLRFGNVGSSSTDVTITIGPTDYGPYPLAAGASMRVALPGVNNGPVKIHSTGSVPIIASERVIYIVNGIQTSFSEMMGLPGGPGGLLTDTYQFPWYNNVDLDTQLRFGNVGLSSTDVTITIGLTNYGPYPLAAGASLRVALPGVNNGPVKIHSTGSVPIIASERVIYIVNGTQTSFSEMMGLPVGQLTDTYQFPWYNNVDLDTQLRFGNVGTSSTAVTITVGNTDYGPYPLAAGASLRVALPGVNSGPVKVRSGGGAPIIASERVIYNVNGILTSFSEMMGLPIGQLTYSYQFPWYNNVDLDSQLRFGNP